METTLQNLVFLATKQSEAICQGDPGEPGKPGTPGVQGQKGATGYTGRSGPQGEPVCQLTFFTLPLTLPLSY